jgi:hypothetical protein
MLCNKDSMLREDEEKLVRAVSTTMAPFTASAAVPSVTPPRWGRRGHSTRLLPMNKRARCEDLLVSIRYHGF